MSVPQFIARPVCFCGEPDTDGRQPVRECKPDLMDFASVYRIEPDGTRTWHSDYPTLHEAARVAYELQIQAATGIRRLP